MTGQELACKVVPESRYPPLPAPETFVGCHDHPLRSVPGERFSRMQNLTAVSLGISLPLTAVVESVVYFFFCQPHLQSPHLK
jgi:hypothetical protein